jgi:hypothetical protein
MYVADDVNITVNVLDESGNSFIDDFKPDDQPNGTADPDSNITGDDPDRGSFIMRFNWSVIIFAIIFAIIIIIAYTMYLMRKTKKKFEMYRTAQEILESKDIDSAHPIVAGFLTEKGQITASDSSKLGDIELTATEAATLKEAFAIGTGRYRHAQEELMIIDKPYSAAARKVSSDIRQDYRRRSSEPPPAVKAAATRSAYEPEYVSPPPMRPYKVAAKKAAEAAAAGKTSVPARSAIPMALPVPKSDKKGPYQPEHIDISTAKPYDTAGKLQALEQKLKDGKISKKLFDELSDKYSDAGTTKPVTINKSYQPEYMYLRAEKPYDDAAKLLKLEQKYREGKISKRLYEELKSNYV